MKSGFCLSEYSISSASKPFDWAFSSVNPVETRLRPYIEIPFEPCTPTPSRLCPQALWAATIPVLTALDARAI